MGLKLCVILGALLIVIGIGMFVVIGFDLAKDVSYEDQVTYTITGASVAFFGAFVMMIGFCIGDHWRRKGLTS